MKGMVYYCCICCFTSTLKGVFKKYLYIFYCKDLNENYLYMWWLRDELITSSRMRSSSCTAQPLEISNKRECRSSAIIPFHTHTHTQTVVRIPTYPSTRKKWGPHTTRGATIRLLHKRIPFLALRRRSKCLYSKSC